MNLSFPILLDHPLCLIQYSLGLFIILMIWLRESLGCARSGRKLPSYGWLEITLIVDGFVDTVTFILRRSGEDVEYDRLTETTNKVVFHVKMGMGGQRVAFAQLISMPLSYQEEAGVGEEEKVVLNMLSDLAQDTVVILGKDK